MYIRVDLEQIPPFVEVREPDDFARFHVVVAENDHAWVHPSVLAELAGRTDDTQWRGKLASMVKFAEGKGWVEQGLVKAHVEVERS